MNKKKTCKKNICHKRLRSVGPDKYETVLKLLIGKTVKPNGNDRLETRGEYFTKFPDNYWGKLTTFSEFT